MGIVLIYMVLGSIWVFISNQLANIFLNDSSLKIFSAGIDDLSYVLVSAILFYWLIFNAIQRVSETKTETKISNEELEKTNKLLSSIIESSPEIIIYSFDTSCQYTAFNQKHYDTMFSTYGIKISKGMGVTDSYGKNKDMRLRVKNNLKRVLNGETFMFHEQTTDESNSRSDWQVHYSPILSKDGSVVGSTCFSINITELKKAEESNKIFGFRDELTGLYNRRFYYEELKRIDKPENYPIAVIMGDVNGLKLINDAFGHHMGDKLLTLSANCISSACRPKDIAARWGGDEFVILMRKSSIIQAKSTIERIKQECRREHVNSINVDISFGYGVKETGSEDIQDIVEVAEAFMYKKKIVESKIMRNKTIKIILNTLHEKNPTEKDHSIRVAKMCRKIGSAMELSTFDLRSLYLVGYLHDIGKISISDDVLNKPGRLTPEELKIIREHSENGCRIIRSSYEMSEIANAILSHHERWDGTGYPKGLKHNEIPKFSKIVTIADCYDAMISKRIYKGKLNHNEAIEEIINNSGKQFDPDISKIFLEKVLNYKIKKAK